MKTTSNYTITKVQQGIFTVLLLSQLLTSCGGEAREIGTEALQAPLQSSSAGHSLSPLSALSLHSFSFSIKHVSQLFQ